MVEVNSIRPASYNPRKIEAVKADKLKESLRYVGFGKPIIVNSNGTIIAGHQRTNAAKAIGMRTVPAFVLDNVSEEDEVRFNQIHNSADIDANSKVSVTASTVPGFRTIDPEGVTYHELPRGANARAMIHTLFLRHGQFSAAIATQDGEVLSGHQYAVSMSAICKPLLVFYIPTEKKEMAKEYLSENYGKFSYDHLKKNTYVQSFAQKFRLRSESHGRSTLYANFVIPQIRKTEKVFDFGCGQADYIRKLANEGYNVSGLEFYYRHGNDINMKAIDRMVDHLLRKIVTGRYDVVVCDSVLNSVDTLSAESDVVNVCNMLMKMGGRLYISGRRWEFIESLKRHRRQKNFDKRYIEFLDDHGFSALYRSGEWFYQKFHTKEMAARLIRSKGFQILHHEEELGNSSWQIVARKVAEIPEADGLTSVCREFSLPLPGGKRHRYAPQAVETFKKVYQHVSNNPKF